MRASITGSSLIQPFAGSLLLLGYHMGPRIVACPMPPKPIKKKSSPKGKPHQSARSANATPWRSAVSSAEEELLTKIFRSSPHPIGITELESGRCLEINDACLEIFGFRRDEVIGQTNLLLGIWPDPQVRAEWIARIHSEGSIRNVEVTMRMKNGDLRHFLISTDLITLKGKQCLLTVGNDVTERRQVEEALRLSEERWQLAATGTTDGIWDWDVARHTVFLSWRWKQVHGYREEEIGVDETEWSSRIHPEDSARVMATVQSYFNKAIPTFDCEYRTRHKDGTYYWVNDRGIAVWDEQGRVVRMVGSEADITERKRAEEALRLGYDELEHRVAERTSELDRSNERLRAEIAERNTAELSLHESDRRLQGFLDHSPNVMFMKDLQGCYLEVNTQFEQIFHLTRQDIIGKTDHDVFPTEQAASYQSNDLQVLKSGRALQFEEVALHDDGLHTNIVWKFPLRQPDGTLYAICGIATDISDRKRAEDKVRRSEVFLNSILDNLPIMIFVKEARNLRFVRLNKAGETLLGYFRGELMGKNDYDVFPRNKADFFTGKDREVLASGRLLDIPEEPIRTRSGEVRYLHTKKIPIIGKDGLPEYLLGISEDITDRKQIEAALRFSKFSIERAADAVYWVDPQAKILGVNEAASLMLGYSKEELCAMTVHDLNPDFQADMWPEFWADTRRRGTMVLETFHRAKNGRLIPIEVSVNYLSYEGKEYHCAFVRNITERKQVEKALRQKQLDLQSSQAQLQDLASQLLEAQEIERQRIARDLHDDFSQRLTALVLDVAALQRQPPRVPELTGKALEPVCKELEQLTRDLHDLAYRLHPPLLRHVGLQAAIEDHIHKAMERTGLGISLKATDVPGAIPLEWSLCLFRVLQESLQNIVKHAKATEVLVKLSGSSHGIGLSVIDNGTGFDKRGHQKGLGLISMQERLRFLDGFLNIHSRPADGTKVCAWIPFREQTR